MDVATIVLTVRHSNTELYASAIAIREFREYKKAMRGGSVIGVDGREQRGSQRSDEEEMIKRETARIARPKQPHAHAEWQQSERSRQQNGGW